MSGSSAKPGASSNISHGMAISARIAKATSTSVSPLSACAAKSRAAASPRRAGRLVKSGMKAALKAPSAKMRRNMLGTRKPTKKASVIGGGAEHGGDQHVADEAEHAADDGHAADGGEPAIELHGAL